MERGESSVERSPGRGRSALSEPESECFSYERLRVWRKAVDFANWVYAISRSFPREEMFGLTSQVRRASVSVAANIAEGTSRSSAKDRVRFFEIAYGSLSETATLFHIAAGQGLVGQDVLAQARSDIADMSRMLSGLRRSLTKESK